MTQSDQMKIMRKGFRIIRPDVFRLQIKTKTEFLQSWSTLEKGFASKAALERSMRELLQDKLTIED